MLIPLTGAYEKPELQKALTEDGIAILDNALLPDKAEVLCKELMAGNYGTRGLINRENEDGSRFIYKKNRIQFDSGAETSTLIELRNYFRSNVCLNWVTLMPGL